MLVSTVNFVDLYIDVQNLALLVLLPRANQYWLVAQYNCLEFKNFARIWLLVLVPKKFTLTFNSIVTGGFIYGAAWWWFFEFLLLNMCAPRIMALLVPVHFMFIQEIVIEGFVLKKNVSSYSFVWKLLLDWGFLPFKKAIFGYFL